MIYKDKYYEEIKTVYEYELTLPEYKNWELIKIFFIEYPYKEYVNKMGTGGHSYSEEQLCVKKEARFIIGLTKFWKELYGKD